MPDLPRLISDINDRILTALRTYEWKPTASMLYFAISLGISESYLRINVKKLEKLGLIEPFVAGKERGKSVINSRSLTPTAFGGGVRGMRVSRLIHPPANRQA